MNEKILTIIKRINWHYLQIWYLERELDFIGVVPTIFGSLEAK